MNKALLFSAMGLIGAVGSTAAQAQEVGRVISSTPVIQQVAVPRQVCAQQPVAVQQPSTGGGAVVGAIVGGLLGNTIGGGAGRAAATGLGAVAGAAVGDNVEGRGQYQTQLATQCSVQTSYENRTTAYNVVYEYSGKQYTVQMPYDPGQTIPLQVRPMMGSAAPLASGAEGGVQPSVPASQVPQAIILAEQPSGVYPPPAYYPAYPAAYPVYPAYPAYYPRPYFAPIGISLGFGYVHHSGGRHWRH